MAKLSKLVRFMKANSKKVVLVSLSVVFWVGVFAIAINRYKSLEDKADLTDEKTDNTDKNTDLTGSVADSTDKKTDLTDSSSTSSAQVASEKAPIKWGEKRFETPSYLKDYNGKWNVSEGTVKFTTVDSTKEGTEVLVYGNFNGVDEEGLFKIWFGGHVISFDTFDDNGQEGLDGPNFIPTGDFLGKKYNIKVTWNFKANPPVKRLYVDGNLVKESFPKTVPVETHPFLLIGEVSNFQISGKFEAF